MGERKGTRTHATGGIAPGFGEGEGMVNGKGERSSIYMWILLALKAGQFSSVSDVEKNRWRKSLQKAVTN